MSEIDAGAGYRLLTDGEEIQASDEFLFSGLWILWANTVSVGSAFDSCNHSPTRRVDAGAGYRLLQQGEIVLPTDEFVCCVEGDWIPRARTGGVVGVAFDYHEHAPTRRKTGFIAIQLGVGYRLLTDGEIFQAGDEFFSDGGEWVGRDTTIGDRMGSGFKPTRRKAVDAGAGYRLLTVGETIQAGDEYLDDEGIWSARGCSVGDTMARYYVPTRRKIAVAIQPGAGYRLLHAFEPILPGDEFLCGEKWMTRDEIGTYRYDAKRRAVYPGVGYRILAVGEIVDRSDEVFMESGRWEPTCFSCGPVVGGTYRRRQQSMADQLKAWLDTQTITSDNIYEIRKQCFVPWCSGWNALVRDETTLRENAIPMPPTPDIRML